jgi:hypothetical protein
VDKEAAAGEIISSRSRGGMRSRWWLGLALGDAISEAEISERDGDWGERLDF